MISLINCDRIDPLNLIELRGIFFILLSVWWVGCKKKYYRSGMHTRYMYEGPTKNAIWIHILVFNGFHTSFLILSLKGMNLKSDHRYTQAYIRHCDQNI